MFTMNTGKRRVLMMGALAAALTVTISGLLMVRGTEGRASRSPETDELEEAHAAGSPAPARAALASRRAAALPAGSPRSLEGLDDEDPDAAAPTRPMPAWLDAGPWGFDDLAAFWEKERRDTEWSANVEGYLSAMLEPEELNLDLLNRVDCRETLCRIEMNAAHMPVIARLRGGSGPDRPRFAHKWTTEADGASVVVVYAARDDLAERVFPADAASGGAASD